MLFVSFSPADGGYCADFRSIINGEMRPSSAQHDVGHEFLIDGPRWD